MLPAQQWQELLVHCRRKISGNHLACENQDFKAFGLIGGRVNDHTIDVVSIAPLYKNARGSKNHKRFMDHQMECHAIPSVTPFTERGWVADQQEVDDALKTMHSQNCSLIGTYHMHRVAWDHDPIRDTPTELDLMLGQGSRMLMFIISMVDPAKPIIKAFFEGVTSQEIPIEIV
nr:hypothetical protein [Desulfobulbaceae bacterium]